MIKPVQVEESELVILTSRFSNFSVLHFLNCSRIPVKSIWNANSQTLKLSIETFKLSNWKNSNISIEALKSKECQSKAIEICISKAFLHHSQNAFPTFPKHFYKAFSLRRTISCLIESGDLANWIMKHLHSFRGPAHRPFVNESAGAFAELRVNSIDLMLKLLISYLSNLLIVTY